MKYNMPYKREKEQEGGNSGGQNLKLYRPLENKPGLKTNNEVLVPLCSPTKWNLFNPTPEQAVKYGYAAGSDGGSLRSIPSDLFTFYFKLFVHKASKYQRPDGSVGFAYIICPIKFNDYLVKVLGFGPLFEEPRCAHCEKEREWWDAHKKRWAELGYDDEAKKALTTPDYRKMVDGDPVLKKTREVARGFKAMERYVINIFDHDKFTQKRSLDEGQTSVEYQLWLAPRSIFDKLNNIYEISESNVEQGLDVPFFDTSSPQGLHVLTVIKDTTECVGNNFIKTKYDVMAGKRHVYTPEWLAYLNNIDARVDPSEFVFLANYEDTKHELADKASPSAPQETSPVVPQTTPQVNMPGMGSTPQASVPTPPSTPVPVQQEAPVQQAASSVPTPPTPPANGAPTPPTPVAQTAPVEANPVTPIAPAQTAPPSTAGLPSAPISPDRTPPAGSAPPAQKHKW